MSVVHAATMSSTARHPTWRRRVPRASGLLDAPPPPGATVVALGVEGRVSPGRGSPEKGLNFDRFFIPSFRPLQFPSNFPHLHT